jgi:FMN phosphatase YigB (HAD superfamily)
VCVVPVRVRLVDDDDLMRATGELVIEESTANIHVKRILMKLGLRDRIQAVIFAYETGLTRPGRHDRAMDGPSSRQ